MNKQKGFVKILIIGIAVIIVGIAGYFALIQKPTKVPTPQVFQPTKPEKVFVIYERGYEVFKSDIDGKSEIRISSLDFSNDYNTNLHPSNNGKYVIKRTFGGGLSKLELLSFNQPEILNTVVELSESNGFFSDVIWSDDDSKIAYIESDWKKAIFRLFVIDKDGKNRKLVKIFNDLTAQGFVVFESFNSSQNKIYYRKTPITNGAPPKWTYEIIDFNTNQIKQLDSPYILSSDFSNGYYIKDSNIIEKNLIIDSEEILDYGHGEERSLTALSPKDDFLVFNTTMKDTTGGEWTLTGFHPVLGYYLLNLKNNKIDILFKPESGVTTESLWIRGEASLSQDGRYLYISDSNRRRRKIIDIENKTTHSFREEDKDQIWFLRFGVEE